MKAVTSRYSPHRELLAVTFLGKHGLQKWRKAGKHMRTENAWPSIKRKKPVLKKLARA